MQTDYKTKYQEWLSNPIFDLETKQELKSIELEYKFKKKNIKVIHYASIKPWNELYYGKYYNKYWKYAKNNEKMNYTQHRNKNKIIMYPTKENTENRYLNNLYNTIKEEYEVIGFDQAKKNHKLFNSQIYHFNWIENNNSNNNLIIKKNYIKKMILIKLLKIFNKKIIWTVHNNIPHDAKNEKEVKKFLNFMAKNSDRIHILCNETLENNEYLKKYKDKIVCIPHGDYIKCYEGKDINVYKKYNISSNKKIILFIGQVRKYKNIELLIKAFVKSKLEDDNYVLLICGKCNDELYKEELNKMSSNNIFFDFHFIADEEIGSYLKVSEIVVAPYNKNSSLNSGTLWMAMSYTKTMALPLIGCVKDIKDYNNFLYTYDYDNEEEHYNALLKCLLKIKSDITENSNILEEKGKKAYLYIFNNQTWELLKEKWINLYKFS